MVALLVGVGTSACSEEVAAGELAGRTYVSVEAAGHEIAPGSEVRLIFQSDRISVNAGCNTLNGAATWDAGVLSVSPPMARTMMACTDDLSRQDDWLEAFLTSEPSLSVDGSRLVLGDDDEGLTLDAQ